MNKNRTIVVSLVAALAAACGGSKNGGSKLTPETFGVELGKASCSGNVACGYAVQADVAACEAEVTANAAKNNPTAYDLAAAVKAGRLKFDAAKAKICLDATKAPPSCTTSYSFNGDDCLGVYLPQVEVGGACNSSGECKSGQCLGGETDGCAGTCKAPAALGAACDDDKTVCADGLQCNIPEDAAEGTCEAFPSAPGEACTSDNDCDYDHWCFARAATPTQKQCLQNGQVGDTCTSINFLGLIFTNCDPTLFCNVTDAEASTGLCAALPIAGAACSQGDECKPGTVCKGLEFDQDTGAVMTPGTCVVPLAVGATCDPAASYSGCPSSYPCSEDSSTCAKSTGGAGPGLDEDCTEEYCNSSALYCNNDYICKTKVLFGGTCVERDPDVDYAEEPCDEGTCSGGTCALVCE